MSYSTNYAGLKADLLQNADDYSSEYMANLDTIIPEAETKCLRDLDLEIFQDWITGVSLTANQRQLARPDGLVKINGLWLVVNGSRKFIQKRTQGYCEAYGEDASVKELPSYYAEATEDYFYFVNTPDQAYPAVFYGIARPPGLSQSNPTTWLSTYAGDLLLMACRVLSEKYLSNGAQATIWENTYNNSTLPGAKMELRGMSRATYETAKAIQPASQVL